MISSSFYFLNILNMEKYNKIFILELEETQKFFWNNTAVILSIWFWHQLYQHTVYRIFLVLEISKLIMKCLRSCTS